LFIHFGSDILHFYAKIWETEPTDVVWWHFMDWKQLLLANNLAETVFYFGIFCIRKSQIDGGMVF
jgi:hypothetical protein